MFSAGLPILYTGKDRKGASQMGELAIRRNRGFAVPQYQGTDKVEKASGSSRSGKAAGKAGFTISETLQELMGRVSQVESRSRESRRALQTGEAALDEVRDALERMRELAQKSAGGGEADRDALQGELERLRESIGRIIDSAVAGDAALFRDGGPGAAEETQLLPPPAGDAGKQTGLPDWLLKGAAQAGMSAEQILDRLGLDRTASGADILAAVTGKPLEEGSVEALLATLYLGSVIAGTSPESGMDLKSALEGLLQLLEKVEQGMSPDRAVELLTGGRFTSLADFQAQFTQGSAPGLQAFLTELLLTGEGPGLLSVDGSLLAALAGAQNINLELLMGVLTTTQLSEGAPESETGMLPRQMGAVQVAGQDLSGVSLNAATGELTVGGTADVTILGTEQGEQALILSGSGRTVLQGANVSTLTVEGSTAQVVLLAQNAVRELRLPEGASLTLSGGGGLLKLGGLHAAGSNTLRLTDGAAVVLIQEEKTAEDGTRAAWTVPIVIDGPASLAARGVSVRDSAGNAMEPFDLLWKAMLPGWNALTALELDGRQAKMALLHGDPMRLWLTRGDPSHGYPIHGLVFQGKDARGRTLTRYAYLRWSQSSQTFREISMYPNPFSVTGGEPGRDWVYEEESQTLYILSDKVSAVSGGLGTDGAREPFSGRIALADEIGPLELSLGGVVCRVSSGRAFSLGRRNEVTLVLQSGTTNLFESGPGCAGISLSGGTSLSIDCADPQGGGDPDGVLTATGGAGSAAIGWDSGDDSDPSGHILIRGGVSVGAGGLTGSITIIGGMIVSSDGNGGAARGLTLQMGEDTVTLPQFRLSTGLLRLDGMDVTTREQAQAAWKALDDSIRWVSRIQTAYGALYRQLERSVGGSQYFRAVRDMVRDGGEADTLLEDMRQSMLLQPSQALRTHGRRGTEDVSQLLW